ncbi:hypothetical protein TNCV_2211311 [Trichonephila clavipes]|nr:hypothetical protein TNCV_2211311 [Trichonephila clavipes]
MELLYVFPANYSKYPCPSNRNWKRQNNHPWICRCLNSSLWCSVLYVQSISEEDVSARLLYSKSRVAPVRPITIPRLELCVIATTPGKGFIFPYATYKANNVMD